MCVSVSDLSCERIHVANDGQAIDVALHIEHIHMDVCKRVGMCVCEPCNLIRV